MAGWIYVGGTFGQARWWWIAFSALVYVSVSFIMAIPEASQAASVTGPLIIDDVGDTIRWFALGLGILFTLLAGSNTTRELTSELIATLMLLIVGLMLVARANDLVFLFVSLELVSIPTYVLLYLGRRDRETSEATVKYFFLSILSSALFLYGIAWLYGIAGTTTITGNTGDTIRAALAQSAGSDGLSSLAPMALVLIVAGLGFKIAAVPFHFYAPDVYQGATNANAALLAVAPKVAGVIALIRLVVFAMPSVGQFGWQLALVLAILTMTIGNVCALWQQNLRRMLAYSSIAHGGYLLMGIATAMAAGTGNGLSATLFYLIVYAIASFAAFAILAAMSSEEEEVSSLEELAGLGKSKPVAAAVIAVCMFSLAGIPPLAGFWGKFMLFASTLRLATTTSDATLSMWFVILAICGAVNAAIAAAYYLRVVATMYFQPSRVELGPVRSAAWCASVIAALLVVAIGVFPRTVETATQRAERSSVRLGAAEVPVPQLAVDSEVAVPKK
jgi:NADH-quinone oxidoreductase subunit N